jgi:hypothetical protein
VYCQLFRIVRSTTSRHSTHYRQSNQNSCFILAGHCVPLSRTVGKSLYVLPDGHPYTIHKNNPFVEQCRCWYSASPSYNSAILRCRICQHCLHILHYRNLFGKSVLDLLSSLITHLSAALCYDYDPLEKVNKTRPPISAANPL